MTYYRRVAMGCLLVCLCACSALGSGDTRATMQAEQTAYVDEGTHIVETLRARGTEVMATAVAGETYVANVEGINRQLAATLRALIPPTQQVVDNSGVVTPGMVVNPGELSVSTQPPNLITPTGINQFTQIGTATQVRESDGCASGLQSEFSSSSRAIYITARVLNAVAGATVGAEWIYEGNVIFQSSSYSIPEDDDDFCLWFYIEPTDVQFTPGNWLARFTLNGAAVEPTASFTIN